jgi:hypothetical protein
MTTLATPTAEPPPARPARWRRRGPFAVAVVGVLLLVVAVYVALFDRPVAVDAPAVTGAAADACHALAAELPSDLSAGSRRSTSPQSELTAAWGSVPVVLRCGVDQPVALTPTSQLTTIDGVDWLPERGDGGVRFTTVGLVANVEVTVPGTYAPEARVVAELSSAVARAVPAG